MLHIFEIEDSSALDYFVIAWMCDVMHDFYTTNSHTIVSPSNFELLCETCAVGCNLRTRYVADLFLRMFRIQSRSDFPEINIIKMERYLQNILLATQVKRFDYYDNANERFMSDTCRTNEYIPVGSSCDKYAEIPLNRRIVATPTIVDPGFIPSHVDWDPYMDGTIPVDASDMEFEVRYNQRIIGKVRYTAGAKYTDFWDTEDRKYHEMIRRGVKDYVGGYLSKTRSRDQERRVDYQTSRRRLFDRLFFVFMLDFAQLMYAHDAERVTVVTNDVSMTASAMMLLNDEVISNISKIGRRLISKGRPPIPPRL